MIKLWWPRTVLKPIKNVGTQTSERCGIWWRVLHTSGGIPGKDPENEGKIMSRQRAGWILRHITISIRDFLPVNGQSDVWNVAESFLHRTLVKIVARVYEIFSTASLPILASAHWLRYCAFKLKLSGFLVGEAFAIQMLYQLRPKFTSDFNKWINLL